MKAFIIGLAAAAIALLTAGGIKAALPGIQTDPAPSEGKVTQVRVTAVLDVMSRHVGPGPATTRSDV